MSATSRATALRVIALVGLAASAVLLVDYLSPAPLFCAEGGGCATVRRSAWSHPAGIPMPVFGLAGFGAVLGLSFTRARRLLTTAAIAGGAAAAGLVVLQAAVIGAFCAWCVVADAAGVALAGVALLGRRDGAVGGTWPAWLALAAAVIGGPFALRELRAESQPPPLHADLPEIIAREQRAGVATIVEFADFQCPNCRALHDRLVPLLEEYGDKVRVVRKHWPLVHKHPNALGAAKAACCAEEQDKGEPMAHELFKARDLSAEACEAIAASLGLDLDRYRQCVASERISARIDADVAAARELGLRGVPTFWVGAERFEGAQPVDVIRASIERALRAARATGS